MTAQSVDQKNTPRSAPDEFQTFGIPTQTSRREYNLNKFGSEEEFIARLGLTPRELSLLRSDISRIGISADVIRPLVCTEYIGSPTHRPFQTYNTSLAGRWDLHKIESKIKAHNYLRSVDPEQSFHPDFPKLSAFPAIIREVPAGFLPYVGGQSTNSVSLLLQIPQKDWEHLLRNCSQGPFTMMNALAFVRLQHRKNNHIEVLEIGSPHYDSLRSPELKERYKDWSHILMRAVIDYAAHSRKVHSPPPREGDEERKVENPKAVKVLFASPHQMRLSFKPEEDSGPGLGTVPVFNEQIPDKTKYRVPGLSVKEAAHFYRRLPLHYGFTKGEADLDLTEVAGQKHKNSLIREVPFVTGKSTQDPLFRLERPSPRLRQWIKFGREEFENVDLMTMESQPLPLGHPLRPQPAAHVAAAVRSLEQGAEITEALRFPEIRMIGGTPSRIERTNELRSRIPGYNLFRAIVPDGFTPVSKGIAHGARTDWWAIPECTDGEVSAQFMHLREQNRHPSLRLFVRGADGSSELLGSFGFKGAGVASVEGVRVHQPYERRLPIYRRLEDIVDVGGRKVRKSQYPGHENWGGQRRAGATAEFQYAAEMALFCNGVDPRLASAVAVPVAVERMRSIPSWKKDGTTEWHDPIQYTNQFMDGLHAGNGLFQAVTYSKSDVRLNQLVSKVFGMNGMATDSVSAAEVSIIDAMRMLYYTHGKQFSVGGAELLPSSTFGMRDVGRFLRDLGEVNRAAAEEIYSDFEFRTVAALGAVHGGDGNLGGLARHGTGLMFGGPQTIRNIDLYGTMHDYETHPHLPWSAACDASEQTVITQETEKVFLQGADALLLRETLYWMKNILFGFESSDPVTTLKIPIDSKQDFTVMTIQDDHTLGLMAAYIGGLKSGAAPEKILGEGKVVDLYREYGVRGRELAEQLKENPW